MGNFRDRSFNSRFAAMGDQAEAVFEAVATRGFVRYGLDRPPIRVSDLDPFVRYTPDYLQGKRLVEVQGCGQDGMLKFKVDKIGALAEWQEHMPVVLFVYDSKLKRYAEFSLDQLIEWMEHAARGMFPEGKEYVEIPVSQVEGWVDVPS